VVVSQTPIPNRPDGYMYGSTSSPVILEAFYDLLCPDSAASWPTIQQVVGNYEGQLGFIFHTFPLPYHTFSFIANQGMHVIAHAFNNSYEAVSTYATFLFKQQSTWYNANTMSMSTMDVVQNIAKAVEGQKIISSDAFIAGINDTVLNYETRVSWKYGCSRGQVTGTPTFLVNGVFVNASPSWTLDDWKQIIDPLLQADNMNTNTNTKTDRSHHRESSKKGHINRRANNGNNNRHVEPETVTLVKKSFFPSAQQNNSCPSGETFCQYTPDKFECCLAGENCIPNVGCRCLKDAC
jgi:hypothetical protein